MAHRNARLTLHGRRLLIQRVVGDGRPVAHVVEELGVSHATGYKWLTRWRTEGDAGLTDRPSTAHRLPGKTSPELEALVCELRTRTKRGPRRLAPLLGLPASTIHAVLTRHGLHRLAWLDRPTGQLIRRYERDRPGELIHVDARKSAGYAKAAAGASTAAAASRTSPPAPAPESATNTSTPPSTTTPGSPTPRFTPTRKPIPAPGSCTAPPNTSRPWASPPSNA
jgi:transposase